MAETEILSTANLQVASNSSANNLALGTNGRNRSVNSSFNGFLNDSIEQISDADGGNFLPIEGKNLPQALNDLKSTLQSFINDISSQGIDVASLTETLQEGVAENLFVIQQQLNIFPESEQALQPLSDNLLELSSSIEDTLNPELQNVNELANQIIDQLNTIPVGVAPILATQDKNIPIIPAQSDDISSVVTSIENQRLFSVAPQAVDIEAQQDLLRNSATETEELVNFTAVQKIENSESTIEKLDDFIAKYLSEDNSSKNYIKNQVLNADILQQNITAFKSDSSVQNINVGTAAVDSYANFTVTPTQHKLIEAPIPLLIKQGLGSEQIQQNVDESIAQNVKWLIGNKAQNARINVFPESLGQVNIALSLEDSNLKLNFLASSNATKELIEASVATLRSNFNESGINLQEVNVETRFSNQSEQDSQLSDLNSQSAGSFNSDAMDITDQESESVPHELVNNPVPQRLLDAYA